MDAESKLCRDQFIEAMLARMEAMLGQVADAVNEAPPGYVISGSEGQVRDLFADLRREAYEQAVQMRTDAASGTKYWRSRLTQTG